MYVCHREELTGVFPGYPGFTRCNTDNNPPSSLDAARPPLCDLYLLTRQTRARIMEQRRRTINALAMHRCYLSLAFIRRRFNDRVRGPDFISSSV